MDKNNWFSILNLIFLTSFIYDKDVRKYAKRGTLTDTLTQVQLKAALCLGDKKEYLSSLVGENGERRIECLPPGRQLHKDTYLGYENDAVLAEITNGK